MAEPGPDIGDDVALGMVLLVDLDHLGEGRDLLSLLPVDVILEGLPLPEGEDLVEEARPVRRMDEEGVLFPRREFVDLFLDPGDSRLGEDHSVAGAAGPVADEEFVLVDADADALEGGTEGLGPLDGARFASVASVAFGDDASLLDRELPLDTEDGLLLAQDSRAGATQSRYFGQELEEPRIPCLHFTNSFPILSRKALPSRGLAQ
jgi:hypothetical protein